MNRKTKIIFVVAAVLSVLYAVLSGLGIAGIQSYTGGLIYRLIIISVLFYSNLCVLKNILHKPVKNEAFIAGALGLGMLLVFEVYSFIYIYLYDGQHTDITISNYIRNCVYLFFLVAISYLTPPILKSYKTIRFILGITSTFLLFIIFFAVIINSYTLLAYGSLIIKIFCFIVATVLFFKVKKGHPARLFSISVRLICLLETAQQLLFIYGNIWDLYDIFISFMPLVYLLFGYTLIQLQNIGEEHYE